jgi:hypothetical protein
LHPNTNRWGIELNGCPEDIEAWRTFLKPPFDPFVEEVEHQSGNYLALRSSVFDGMKTSQEVHRAAKDLLDVLNVVMLTNADTHPIASGAVIELVADGPPRKHLHLEVTELVAARSHFYAVVTTAHDLSGNVIKPPPAPSQSQIWMQAAALEPNIGSALRYLNKPGWVELYKAYEAVRHLPHGGIAKSEISRFKQTANAGNRHHPNNTHPPPAHPMELWEARTLITRWISAAIKSVYSKH